MPRACRYVSATVRPIGCEMAHKRRAASGDPVGPGSSLRSRAGLGRGRPRKCRASSRVSRRVSSLRLAAIRSSRSPYSPVAESVQWPAAPLPVSGSAKADEQAAARRVVDVADQPVATLAATVGEIMAAHRLGIARETVRQVGGLSGHRRRPIKPRCDRRPAPADGARARRRGSSGPPAPTGTNRRSRQAMISEVSPIAFNRSTMPSVKPQSSTRCAFITSERRTSSPSARCNTPPLSNTVANAATGASAGASSPNACATQAGETWRPMTRSPSSVWSR